MQTTSLNFRQLAAGHVRPISGQTRASFDKAFNEDTTFFTLDTSLLDGTDVLAPIDDNPLQQWDKYEYADYTDKIISLEVTREETEPYSIGQAYADITLNNFDNYFTPNSGSPIDTFILPRRPFRILMGFDNEVVPQIVGLSQGMPEINKSSRQASFHIKDFMSYLLDQDVSESVILQDVYTHEVLDYLFQNMGLLESQYSLDDSFNIIKFFYVEKGEKFGPVADKLMEAEIGRLYMDEAGIIRFRNRYNYDLAPVYNFDKSNVIDYSVSNENSIINSVKINSEVRDVQPLQNIWTYNALPVRVNIGQTVTIWAEFPDPVTSVVDPIYSAVERPTSYFTATLQSDGVGSYTGITLVSLDAFSKTAKLVFQNTGASIAFVKYIDLYGTPAKVIDTIKVEEIDQASIDKFEEQIYEITNEYIQDESNAESRALILLRDFADYGATVELEVKGNPALQLGDAVDLDLDGYQGVHVITKSINIISEGSLTSRLRVKRKIIPSFFILDTSLLDGTDQLSP